MTTMRALIIGKPMASITIRNLDDELKSRLHIRAAHHGRSMEEEAREILRAILAENAQPPTNLAASIRALFADIKDFELPQIPREPLREPPSFDA
jgi:antitoxin FitA